jgi:molybdenum cofactor cytidylyltransferase
MTYGLIPAAGKSTRMGRPKLALPVAGRTVLGHVIAALRAGGAGPTLVVLGPHVAELAGPAREAGAEVLVLGHETPDMRATVEEGLRWLEEQFAPTPDDDWLLVPADHPALRADVVVRLREARAANPGKTIFVPTWEGRHGHPTLIRWSHVAGVRAYPAGEGLNAYLRRCADETLEVEAGPEVVEDLDTPEDYDRLLRRAGGETRTP